LSARAVAQQHRPVLEQSRPVTQASWPGVLVRLAAAQGMEGTMTIGSIVKAAWPGSLANKTQHHRDWPIKKHLCQCRCKIVKKRRVCAGKQNTPGMETCSEPTGNGHIVDLHDVLHQ
jgi:hypothetical protein